MIFKRESIMRQIEYLQLFIYSMDILYDIFSILAKTVLIIQMFHHYNLSIITILLFISSPSFCATSQRYQLFFNESNNPTSNRQFRPIYDLGILQVGHSISITLTLPNSLPTDTLPGLIPGDTNNALKLYFDDWTDSEAINTRQALTQDGNLFRFPPASLSSNYAAEYRITFGRESSMKSARFKLALFSSDYTASNWFKVAYIYLKVTYKSDEAGAEGITLLQVTQNLRNNVQKVFYVAPSAPPFKFSFFPVTLTENGPNNPFQINLYSLQLPMLNLQGNEWDLKVIKEVNKIPFKGFAPGQSIEQQLAQKINETIKFYGNVAHYSIYLLSGFYLLDINYRQNSTFNGFLAWGKFYTDAYACPYNPQFIDINGNFQGCTPQYNFGGPHCITYDDNNKCLLCLPGQVLNSQGKCGDNPKCPPRKYSNQCLDVNPLCGNFDLFTGECFSCLDPQKYQVINRQCVKKFRCHQRQWVLNDVCMDVSPDCGQFDRSNGKCLSCKDPFYEVNVDDGTCEMAGINGVTCPPGQYAVRYSCMHIPLECANFDKKAGKCLKCIEGYTLQRGKCSQIQNK